jgi:hypothetical protein
MSFVVDVLSGKADRKSKAGSLLCVAVDREVTPRGTPACLELLIG